MDHNNKCGKLVAGSDIAKDTFDAHLLSDTEDIASGQFDNNLNGYIKYLKWAQRFAKGRPIHFCMEATGAYSDGLAIYLAEQSQLVSVVNPHRIHHWSIANGQGNKTDKADARAIANYCLQVVPSIWRMAKPEVRELTALVRHLDSLKQHATQQKNRLLSPGLPDSVTNSLKKLLKQLEDEIKAIEKQIDKHIDSHPDLKRDRGLLLSIPGIGNTTAVLLLAELPDVEQFVDAKLAAKFAGLCPSQYQSGTSVHKKTQRYKRGKRRLRSALYMPAMTAIRYNEHVKAIYLRLLDKGHKGTSALVAAMRKLLMIAVGVLKSGQPYRADYLTA
jgi:transposase